VRLFQLSAVWWCAACWAGGIEQQLNVRIPMRDGVHLAANLFRPAGAGRLPALLVRTPYGKGAGLAANYRPFVEAGYAVVLQDVRGRFGSEGAFDPLRQESNDGEDTLNWIARQSWSNQRIGMLGGSYLGIVQWKAALLANPYLKAIFPLVSGCDDYLDRFYSRGGALKLGQRLEWMAQNVRAPGTGKPPFERFVLHLPLRTADRAATHRAVDFFQQALDHPSYDAYWKALSTRAQLHRVSVPVFSVGGWYDNFVESDLEAFRILRSFGKLHRILIGPWPHSVGAGFTEVDFGPQAKPLIRKYQLEWFDYWLKADRRGGQPPAAAARPPARIFVMGVNRWRDEEQWPLRRARPTAFYLSSQGRANSLEGDGRLARRRPPEQPPDQFVYDPRDPVPTTGGPVCCDPNVFPWGPRDQRALEKRRDVLVYSSEPLARDLEVTGPVRVALWVSTSAPDTDFTAKLVDVHPDGRALNLCDGILRLRYRESLEQPAPARPGEVYQIALEAGVTSNVFRKGHRVRLEISSSNFPRFDRNPNTGRAAADEQELRRASQTLYHDRRRPSRLELPVVR
jgi:hypothetical protein